MKKGQSFIIEFILFFVISFSLFTTISYFFYRQNVFYKGRVGEITSELVNNLISTDIIRGVSCKACDQVLITEEIPSKIGGFYYKTQLDSEGLKTTLFMGEASSKQNQIFNLDETFSLSGESTSENKRAGIKVNNIDQSIEVE